MKIEAASRLMAVRIAREGAYSDAQGLEDLENLTWVLNKKPKIFIGKNKNDFSFWWVKNQQFLVCVKDEKACGFIEFYRGLKTVYVDNDTKPIRGMQISVTFMAPDYRGKGLMLGMHQYLITQTNLISDDTYTPQGLTIWKQLKKMGHTIEVIDGNTQTEKSWTEPRTLMLIRRGQ